MARLYRFQWQIELCFKEWKSYANLHKFDTANPHIAEGLMWGACARRSSNGFWPTPRSVSGMESRSPRVAMCARHILEALVTALLVGIGLLRALRRGLAYLLANARRANLDRDRRTGRLRAGLGLVEAAK